MNRAQALWLRLRSSLWFFPAVMIAVSLAIAASLVQWESVDDQLVQRWPRVFGASAAGSREMLSAIATAMITVAGVVFSITIVALSLAASQYSPRVLRNFMRDRPTQWVFGVFVGNFSYCMLVLRTIRGDDAASPFIPSMAVLGAMVYALVAVASLIYFTHHVADSIQASSIVARIAEDARGAIEHLFPQEAGVPASGDAAVARALAPTEWTSVTSRREGYLQAVDTDRLLALAVKHGRVLRLQHLIGSFVADGSIVIHVSGRAPVPDTLASELRSSLAIGRQRTVEQDAAFGFQQLVDIAVKALSPGINDPATACNCVDRLGSLLIRLAGRCIPDSHRLEAGQLRLIAPAPDFRSFVLLAFSSVVRYGRDHTDVLDLVLLQLESAARNTVDPQRRRSLSLVATAVARALHGIAQESAAVLVRRRARRLSRSLRQPHA